VLGIINTDDGDVVCIVQHKSTCYRWAGQTGE